MALPLAASSNNPFRRKSAAVSVTPPSPLPLSLGPLGPAHVSHASINATDSSTAASIATTPSSPPPPPPLQPQPPQASEAASEASEASESLALGPEPIESSTSVAAASAAPGVSPPLQAKKKKKKVRVLSPPPSSPETEQPVYPPIQHDSGGHNDGRDAYQGSDAASQDPSAPQQHRPLLPSSPLSLSSRPPPTNPFHKTLQDIEPVQKDHPNAPAAGLAGGAKGTLDVDAFRRLLLTGQSDTDGLNSHAPLQSSNNNNNNNNNNVLPMDCNEADAERVIGAVDSKAPKKPPPPPPPVSRRSRLMEKRASVASAEGLGIVSPWTVMSPINTDVTISLPPGPISALEANQDLGSPFDREVAGDSLESGEDSEAHQLPPPRPSTSPKPSPQAASAVPNSTAGSLPSPVKKPAAPPPRRHGHARNDSKAPLGGPPPSPGNPIDGAETPPRRPSLESTRSRSSSLRASVYAPAPPPPRRQNLALTRSSSSAIPSPSTASFGGVSSVTSSVGSDAPQLQGTSGPDGSPELMRTASDAPSKPNSPPALKLSSGPPPPPPTRNPSVRAKRPPSVSSIEGAPRRNPGREKSGGSVGGASGPPTPPPPPPRVRGNSRSSLDDANGGGPRGTSSRTASFDSTYPKDHQPNVLSAVVAEEEADAVAAAPETAPAANDILADLDALQREVDALRGRYAS